MQGHLAHRKHSFIPSGRCRHTHELFLLNLSFCHAQWFWRSLLSQNIWNFFSLYSFWS
jgi:hypothetical protein